MFYKVTLLFYIYSAMSSQVFELTGDFLFLLRIMDTKMLVKSMENIIAKDGITETFIWKKVMESLIPVNINIHATPYLTYAKLL